MTTPNESDQNPEIPLQQDPATASAPAVPVPPILVNPDPWAAIRKVLACNPLYLLSAALLLYSFYLVSADVAFFRTDIGRLSFNLGSLQLYELVLVATAIWLAKRAIWYDSTLLAGLEHLLLLVPFILLSEAALINPKMVWMLSIGAAAIAAARIGCLRKFIRELNFPRSALVVGLFVLIANAVLLIVFRVLHQSKIGKQPDSGTAFQMHQYTWWLVLPFVVALGKFVPFCSRMFGDEWPKRKWLPLTFYSLWLAGTCVHFYCLGYVYDFDLRPDLVAPALWAFSWLLWVKLSRIAAPLKSDQQTVLWVLPAIATLFAFGQPSKAVYLVLTTVNIAAYIILYDREKSRMALHLALISGVALLAGLPEEWGRRLIAEFSRERFVVASAAIYLSGCATMSRDPKAGLLGALVSAFITGTLLARTPDVAHWVTQIALVYLLLHSIRWNDSAQDGSSAVRWLAATGWVLHSLAWVAQGAGWELIFMASVLVAVSFFARLFAHLPWRMVIIASALLVAVMRPSWWAVIQLKDAPTGVLAMISSFVLFGFGTLAALTRAKWSAPRSRSSSTVV